jgi:hypothetical protein
MTRAPDASDASDASVETEDIGQVTNQDNAGFQVRPSFVIPRITLLINQAVSL